MTMTTPHPPAPSLGKTDAAQRPPSAESERDAHTRGPWHFKAGLSGADYAFAILAGEPDTMNPVIADVCVHGNAHNNISEANARLIAAAPDLLAAAKQIIERMSSTYRASNGRQMGIQGDDGEKCWIVHSDDVAVLEAAIAKAVKS